MNVAFTGCGASGNKSSSFYFAIQVRRLLQGLRESPAFVLMHNGLGWPHSRGAQPCAFIHSISSVSSRPHWEGRPGFLKVKGMLSCTSALELSPYTAGMHQVSF